MDDALPLAVGPAGAVLEPSADQLGRRDRKRGSSSLAVPSGTSQPVEQLAERWLLAAAGIEAKARQGRPTSMSEKWPKSGGRTCTSPAAGAKPALQGGSPTGEFDPSSERTLAARLTHASRARKAPSGAEYSGERVSDT